MKNAFLLASCFLFLYLVPAKANDPLSDAERREQQVVERFWTLLEKTPRRGTSFDRVYGYYVDTGRLDELMKRCRESTDKAPGDAKAWLLSGLVLSRRNDDAATVEAFEKAKTLDTTDLLAPFYLGETYIAQGRLRDAAESLESALSRALENLRKNTGDKAASGKDVMAILQTLGRVYERFGDRDNSTRIWDKLEELFPGDRDILVRIAETLEEEGKFDEAFKRYRRLAETAKDDNFARVQFTLAAADIKVRLGDKQGAIDDFETLLEELSGESWLSQSIRDRVERIFVRQADYAGLAGYYQKRLQKHPNDLDTTRRLAVALVRLSRTDEAQKLLADALEKAPSNIPIRLALIDLLAADQDFEAVDRHYAKIDEIEPNNPDHISQWGLAVLENTKRDEPARKAAAVNIWSRLITARPNDPAMLIMVADLANSAKISEEAEKFYKKAIELKPNDPGYKEYLGYFYHHRERKEEAVATLRQIAEGDRRTAANLSQLGGIYKSLGYAEEAQTAMKDAVALAPDDFERRMQYADLLWTNEKNEEAEKEYLDAEKLAKPLTEEFGRFLHAYTRLLQSSLKLGEAVETLAKDNADATASDYWRRATYQAALGQMGAATESIEAAMERAPNTNILLESAANIFEKGNDQVRAAAIYEKLASSDPQRRVEHLKRLANLRRDLGEMDQAIETARLVMATGAGNAANSRFYADMLLGIGRRKDGIEALRRAVRLDPTDTTTLSSLADVLFDSNEIDEALEILWRIFNRTEDLQGKIGAVTRMSTYYQQAQRFDQLIERLRQSASDPASRRESNYCLAQAYVTVSDFEQARQTLEVLLLGGDAVSGAGRRSDGGAGASDDTLLLSQLSKISELQGDIPTAIRYQEMLCDRLQGGPQTGQENERLMSLYQQSGEKEKAVNHLLRFFVEKGERREQVQAIDDLLSREDYASAFKVLDRIEAKQPDQWELLYRRLMLEYWQNDRQAAAGTARRILALETPREEPSAKKRHADQQTTKAAPTPQQQARARMFGQNYQPWGFGEHHGYLNISYGGMSGTLQQAWQAAHLQLLLTLFRDRLQLERFYYNRGTTASNVEPPKPQWEPETFGDARFAAAAWLIRIAMQGDLDAFRKEHPAEEGKPETTATEQNGLKLDRFTEAVNEWRKAAPPDATDTAVIMDRLRLEYFFQQWFQTINQYKSSFSEGNYAKLLFTLPETADGEAAAQALRSKLEFQLAMKGEKEWFPTAYQSLSSEIVTDFHLNELERFDLEKEFDEAVNKAPTSLREEFNDERIAESKRFILERVNAARHSHKSGNDEISPDQKVFLIFQAWNRALESPPENNQYYMVFHSYPNLLHFFRQMGRGEDAAKLEALVEKAAEENPQVAMTMAQTQMFDFTVRRDGPPEFLTCLSVAFHGGYQHRFGMAPFRPEEQELYAGTLQFLNSLQAAAQQEKDPSDEVGFDRQFESFRTGIERLKKAALRMKEKPQQISASPNVAVLSGPSPTMFDSYMMNYLNRVTAPVRVALGNKENPMLTPAYSSSGVMIQRPIPVRVPLPTDKKEEERKKITKEQWDRIAAAEKECYRLLDYFFEQMNEIAGEPEPIVPAAATATQKKPALPSLVNYRSYFEHNQTLQGYELTNILQGQGGRQQGGIVYAFSQTSSEQTLLSASAFFKMLDEEIAHRPPGDGAADDGIAAPYLERFTTYLDEKASKGTDDDKKRVENAKKMIASQGAQASAMLPGAMPSPNEVNVEEKLKELEMEAKELAEKGETLDFRKTFVLALLRKQRGDLPQAVEYLDALPLTGSGDIRYREQLALKWFVGLTDNPMMKKRAETAVQRLLGYQLKGDEMKDLRQGLRLLDRKEEADRIRDRMLITATDVRTQYELLEELRTDPNKERTAQFALKVFRSPAVRNAAGNRQSDMAWHARNRALDILKNNGKLGEIVEQIEAQWKSSPGSLDIMTALADIYNKAGRKEDAQKIAREMAEKIPDDGAKMQSYANLLQNLGMKDEAAEWMQKAFAKNPEQILQNFWQYESSFRESKQIPKLIEILKKIKPQRLASQFSNISYRVNEWQKNAEYKKAAEELMQYVWAMEGVSDNERRQGRAEFVRSLSTQSPGEAFYPMFHEVVFEMISPREADPTAGTVPYQPHMMNPLAVYSWSTTQCWSIGGTFFDIAEKKKNLEETKKELRKVIEAHEAVDEKKRNRIQYRNAKLCLAVNEIRLKNAAAAVELIESAMKEDRPETRHEQVRTTLGLELVKLDQHPSAVELAVKLLEGELKNNPDASHVERVIMVPLFKLYFKTDRAEEGLALALEKLRECFKYLRLMGNTQQFQVGNRYYSPYDLQETALTLSRALLESGHAFDLMIVYREMYGGQAWVKAAKERQNFRFREIDGISKELGEKITAKDFTEKLERMIPGMSESKDVDLQTALPMLLGGYVLPVKLPEKKGPASAQPVSELLELTALLKQTEDADALPVSEEPLAGIRLADALSVIAKEEPARYAAVKKALEELEKAAPEDPSVLIALTCCRLIDRDHPAVETLVRRCVEWTKGEKASGDIDEQICLGFWSLLKKAFADETLMAKPELRTEMETLFRFTGRLVGRLSAGTEDRRAKPTGLSSPVYSFLLDVRRYAPAELAVKLQPDFDSKVFEKILLLRPGQLAYDLNTQRNRIADQLSEAVVLAPRPVMQALRNTFTDGWPRLLSGNAAGRHNSMHLLMILGRVLGSARNAAVDPVIVYEALRDIVLPENKDRRPFLAEYGDLGGENGYFRTPAADLVDWAVAADRIDDLKQRIALKRSHPETTVRLDAVDLLLALKTNDRQRSNELVAMYLKGVRENNAPVSLHAAMAAVPAAKPFEFSDFSEHYPVVIELIDALVSNDNEEVEKANGKKRYIYYVIRSFYDRFEREAALPQKIRWLECYRKITDAARMDGFRFTSEDRLHHEGLQAVAADNLDDAVAVLRYFATCPIDQFRYRDLTEYLAKLQPKLDARDEAAQRKLLGDLEPAKIAKRGNVKRAERQTAELAVKHFDLPPLPEGTVVYQSDFEKQTGPEWSIDRRDTMPKIEKTFLGEFHSEKLRFRLADLPEHRFVRIRFDLLMLAGLDGLVGYPREFGVDVWGMNIEGSGRPIVSAFSNFHADPNAQTQSFPDDYPPEFGVKPSWFDKLLADGLWLYNNEVHGKGVYHGRHGALLENKFGYEKDAAYAVDLIVPHTASELSIEFFTKFQDGQYGNDALNLTFGESWGLDNFRVETVAKPLELGEDALRSCFDALIGNDASKAGAARWRLIAAGNASVEFIGRWFKNESNAVKKKEIQKAGNFDLFRIDRVLQLIAAPEAEALRKDIGNF